MAMFANVLVGVDGTANGRDAIALAAKLTDADGTLTLAHVHAGGFSPLHPVSSVVTGETHDASQSLLEQERAAFGLAAELVSVQAPKPGAGLHRQAERQDADLLVLGTSSRGAVGRVMLGDDTRAALNGSPCAVAVAARGYAANPAPIATIGVAYNGSAESDEALAKARELAAPAGAALRALEVVAIPTYAFTGAIAPSIGDTIETMLAEANERVGRLPDVDGRAVYGLAGEELAAFSGELDLLIVGSRGYGPWRRLVLGSTSDYLQHNARCSLLVLPRPDTADA
jgi:nucleotide-binding universal stress UspA family protein